MRKIALLFDRTYIDAHPCFFELANQLTKSGFDVDLYMLAQANSNQPFFENQGVRILPFPVSKFQKAEYWSKILYSKDRKYSAVIGTPVDGTWVAYKTAKIQRIPYYYLADELIDRIVSNSPVGLKDKLERRNYQSNRNANASIALGKERYNNQVLLNKIDYKHDHFVIPNAPSGNAKRLRSNYFRDVFDIEDRKPILLFAGTLDWILAKKVYEETKDFGEKDYHLIFHARSIGMMGEDKHPFIKISNVPIPGSMMNYVVSSADIGLALYDEESDAEKRNAFTGGKIGTYLKNELPIIAGNASELKFFEREQVGVFWDGKSSFDAIVCKMIAIIGACRNRIPEFYRSNMQYELFFEKFKDHLLNSIKV